MTTLREAAQQALDALEVATTPRSEDRQTVLKAQAALREALAPVPVAWMDREGDLYKMPEIEGWAPPHTLLYTQPPRREWLGLTDEELEELSDMRLGSYDLCLEVEARLEKKNRSEE